MRMVDDFLFITISRTDAQVFLKLMEAGFKEYGCQISIDKALTNIPLARVGRSLVNSRSSRHPFPWCGLLIDQQDLSVTVDYSRYVGQAIRDSLSIDISKRAGTNFVHKMLQCAL
jgi:telomerase reverse transcriptase